MGDEYNAKMAQAANCEQLIARIRALDDPAGQPLRMSFAGKAQREWQELVRSYQEAFDIYRDLNQREKAGKLLDSLLDLVRIRDESTSSLAVHLLLTLRNSYRWMEQVVPGTQEQLKGALGAAIGQKLLHSEMEYWLLLNALNVLRDLAVSDPERRTVDAALCQAMELGAQLSLARGNLDNAEGWLRDAARVAQDRLGDAKGAGRLLSMADAIRRMRAAQLAGSAIQQAPQSEDASADQYPAGESRESLAESLETVLHVAFQEQHDERFLPPLEQMVADYGSQEDKLGALVTDERLVLNQSRIDDRVAKYRGKGLLGVLPGQFVDSQDNPRGGFDAGARFTVQYVAEVGEAVGTLFAIWQEQGHLTLPHVLDLLGRIGPYCDWRIYEAGLSRYFQADFVCAAHTLIPQFEHTVRASAQAAGIDYKKLKAGVPGDILLNDLINPANAEMRELLGGGLFDVIYWYFVNSSGPFAYRHKMAHGWIRPEECNEQLSAMTIWLTLGVLGATDKWLSKGHNGQTPD